MMRRLVEEPQPGPAGERAATLLASLPSGEAPEGAKQRVRRALQSRARGRTWAPRLAPIFVAALLALSLTAVAATVGRGVIARWFHPSRPAPAPAVTPASPTAPRVAMPAPPGVAPEPASAPALSEPSEIPHRSAPVARGPAPARSVSPPAAAPESQPVAEPALPLPASQPAARALLPPDAELVLRAMRRLRHDRDAWEAGVLLDRYLHLHPDGPLAEEALGLAIEAAAARKDSRAAKLARDYLRRFPEGRFAEAARRARARFGEPALPR